MARFTTFRYCLDPTVEQQAALSRHAGASRFAYNECLRMVTTALHRRRRDPDVRVPWTRFSLINEFNRWKRSESAGRTFTVDTAGVATVAVTGLPWRTEVSAQVFEEAAVDLANGLNAFTESRTGTRRGRRVGFPRWKTKHRNTPSFRMRNRTTATGWAAIRVGNGQYPRSVTLPTLGLLRVREDTRRLRRILIHGRGKILSATISRRAGRWSIAVTVEASDLHSSHRHPPRRDGDAAGWVGIDRGLSAFLVAATSAGKEVDRVENHPKPLAAQLRKQQRLARAVTRKRKGSGRRARAVARLARHHRHVRDNRTHFLHQVSTRLVKTHDRLAVEDLNITGMMSNRCLARAIGDVGWGEFARQLHYKQQWRGGELRTVDRWFPSSQLCSRCGVRQPGLRLSDRVFTCTECGLVIDRDRNAAVNLAARAETHYARVRELETPAPIINARGREGAGTLPLLVGCGTGPGEA